MKGLTIDFVSPVDFENIAAEICYENQIICPLNKEREDKVIEIEFFTDARLPIKALAIPLEDFLNLITEVSKELKEM